MGPSAIGMVGGLVAALCFGVGDYLVQGLTHERGWLRAVLAVQVLSAITLVALALAWHGAPKVERLDWAVVALGTVNMIAIVGLYRAFEVGKLSLVSPIAGSMGAFTLLFAWAFGQTPDVVLLPALAVVFVGIMAASVERRAGEVGKSPALGIGWSLVSAVGFGWVFFRLAGVAEVIGVAWAIVALRVVAIPWLLVAVAARSRPEPPTPGRGHPSGSRGRLLAVAVLDGGGLVAVALGGAGGEVAITSVLASAFPVVTILLAHIRLHERLAWWQKLGVAGILIGVGWIGMWRPH